MYYTGEHEWPPLAVHALLIYIIKQIKEGDNHYQDTIFTFPLMSMLGCSDIAISSLSAAVVAMVARGGRVLH